MWQRLFSLYMCLKLILAENEGYFLPPLAFLESFAQSQSAAALVIANTQFSLNYLINYRKKSE